MKYIALTLILIGLILLMTLNQPKEFTSEPVKVGCDYQWVTFKFSEPFPVLEVGVKYYIHPIEEKDGIKIVVNNKKEDSPRIFKGDGQRLISATMQVKRRCN